LREDTAQINEKLQRTRAQLNPTKLIEQRIFRLAGLAFALGCALGYRGVPMEEFRKPAARVADNRGKAGCHACLQGK
jgi:hypothetical protein